MASGDSSAPAGSRSPRKQRKMNDSTEDNSDEEINNALTDIYECQNEIDSLNERAAVEVLDIERQYNKLRKPLYDKRTEMITKGLPSFWVKVFASHPDINVLLNDDQIDCLRHLNKLEVEDSEDIETGYWIRLYFEPNPYFENDVLVKEFRLGASVPSSSSTEIKWKGGMNLVERSRMTNKDAKKMTYTFFDWFADNNSPLQDHIATVIKESVWPSPLEHWASFSDADDDEDLDDDEEDDDDAELGIIDEEDEHQNGDWEMVEKASDE